MTIMTKQETRDYFTSALAEKKSIRAKKNFLTRSKKDELSQLADFKWALDRNGRLFGDYVHQGHVWDAEETILLIDRLYAKL